jgi:hypothetical protein
MATDADALLARALAGCQDYEYMEDVQGSDVADSGDESYGGGDSDDSDFERGKGKASCPVHPAQH